MAEPRAFYMLARGQGAFALPLCQRCAALSSATSGHGGKRTDLSAVQLRALRAAGAHLPRVATAAIVLRGGCAQIRRRESLRRAGERYQRSYRGACAHAARQRAWRERQTQEVTHHGSRLQRRARVTVASQPRSRPSIQQGTHADTAAVEPQAHSGCELAVRLELADLRMHARGAAAHDARMPRLRCSVCGRVLPPFARLGPLRGGP